MAGKDTKFLVIEKVRPETPVDVLFKLPLAQMGYLDRMRGEGKVEELYHMIGRQGIAMICDVGSHEGLSRLLSRDQRLFHMKR